MAIAAKQEIDTGYNFKVKQVEVPHPTRDGKSGYFMNIREDNDDILGWTTERYGLVQHGDAVTFAPLKYSFLKVVYKANLVSQKYKPAMGP